MYNGREHHRRSGIVPSMLLAILPMLIAAPSQAAVIKDWVYFPGAAGVLPFASSLVVLAEGERLPGGSCAGRFGLNTEPGQPAIGAVELAVNLATCQQEVLVGPLLRIPEESDGGQGYQTGSEGSGRSTRDDTGLASTSEGRAHYYVIWRDPLYIQLAKVQEDIDWKVDGTHVVSLVSASDTRSWFSQDGWQETYHHFSRYHDTHYVYGSTTDSFYNYPFCGGTHIEYAPITLFGYANGNAAGSVYTYDYGCDTNLLSWYQFIWYS